MRKCIFILISLLLFSCCIGRKSRDNTFYMYISLGGDIRSGKDYVECWIDDSLLFRGLYIDKYNADIFEYMGDYLGMELPRFNKLNKDSAKFKLRLISLDSLLFAGKRIIDTTFIYQINNIPGIAITCRPDNKFLIWDTLRTPDYFEYIY